VPDSGARGSQAGRWVGIARRDRLYQRHLVESYDPIGSLTWVATDAFVICVLAV
jgi:hypothetical protein